MRIASLGMYDPPWLQAANDALWQAVAERLRSAGWADVPDRLERTAPLGAIWRDPRLLLGQTCGYPLVTELEDKVGLVGSPVYDLPGCEGARHHSVLIVAETSSFATLGDLRGRTLAVNGPDSNTGMNLLRHAVAPLANGGRFFGRIVTTGAHLASMEHVRHGAADMAAIDCVTFELSRLNQPQATAGLRVIGRTARSPSLPFVTSLRTTPQDIQTLRETVNAVLADAAPGSVIAKTALRRIEVAAVSEYGVVLQYQACAEEAGYRLLA